MAKLEKQMSLKLIQENGPAVIGMIMDKNLSSGAKTTTYFCATLPSDTNKATQQHDQTQLLTKYITYTTKLIT